MLSYPSCHAGLVSDGASRVTPGQTGPRDTGGSPRDEGFWWSDGHTDPWRDPSTPTQIVITAPAPTHPATPLEPVPDPDAPRPAGLRVLPAVLITAVLVGVLAGVLGGALGYTYAARDRPSTVLGADPGTAPAAVAERPPDSLAGVVERVLPSVVTVRSDAGAGSSLGSGFVVSGAGHLITNDHVLGDSGTATITYHDGVTTSATVVGRDHESDLAVLRAENVRNVPVQFGDSDVVAVGDQVIAIGSPLALANTVTAGIVSALDRTIQAGDPGGTTRYYAAIQTDAAVNQGNSGGPLLDTAGRVIGINSVIRSVAAVEDEAANIGLAFAIPINHAKRVAQEIIDTGQARRTVLGAELDRIGPTTGGGVRLATVVADGPADRAGLRGGDVLVRFDGRPLNEPADLIALVRKQAPGTVVTVEYRRGATDASTAVTLAADTD